MVTAYWLGEYAKVFIGYILVMYVWPRVVFRGHLKGKPIVYQFGFCASAQVLLLYTLLMVLGMLHILSRWTVGIVLYGVFFVSVFRNFRFSDEGLELVNSVSKGSMGMKTVALRALRRLVQRTKDLPERCWGYLRPRLGECIALTVLLAFGMVYFSWGAFQDYSYGFGDIYVHHKWLYKMMGGELFPSGVYPLGMHSVIYAISSMFGMRIYNLLLFLQGIHVAAFLLAAYCLLRELFRWRYTPALALTLFLVVRLVDSDQISAISRLQWTIPQEFGLYTGLLCVLFLLRYIKSAKPVMFRGKESRFYWDENLLVFALALGASIAVHFYITVIAFFICLAVALVYAKRLFVKKKQIFVKERVVPLAASILCAVLVSLSPMLIAFAAGVPMENSLNWARNILTGTDGGEGRTYMVREELQGLSKPGFWKTLGVRVGSIYSHGYGELYRGGGVALMLLTVLGAGLWALWRWGLQRAPDAFRARIAEGGLDSRAFDGWPVILLASVLLMLLYVAPYLGLPELIAGTRLCSTLHILLMAVSLIWVDLLFSLLGCWYKEQLLAAVSLAGGLVIYAGAMALGCYHGFLYYELTRYNAAVLVTNSIIDEFPERSYTIVSTTDELYPVVEHGWHEELVKFVQKSREEDYYIPSEYVFVYVEKKPLRYAQLHFFDGPAWLGSGSYAQQFETQPPRVYRNLDVPVSQGNELISQDIFQADLDDVDVLSLSNTHGTYKNLERRTALETAAYQWVQHFMELYPYEVNTYYEDDDFVCYYFRQEVNAPYDLGIEHE